jgi:hypothetical protein
MNTNTVPKEILAVAQDMGMAPKKSITGIAPRKWTKAGLERLDKQIERQLAMMETNALYLAMEAAKTPARAPKATSTQRVAVFLAKELLGSKRDGVAPQWNLISAVVEILETRFDGAEFGAGDGCLGYKLTQAALPVFAETPNWDRYRLESGSSAALGVYHSKLVLWATACLFVGEDDNLTKLKAQAKLLGRKVFSL